MTKSIPVRLTAVVKEAVGIYAQTWESIGLSGWCDKYDMSRECDIAPELAHDCLEVLALRGQIKRRDKVVFGSTCAWEYHPLDKRSVTK